MGASARRPPPVSTLGVRQQVEETIEAIRPALQADGGDIFLRDVDEETGVVTVTLVGACGTCPVSTQTLKAGIERIMRDRVDGVTEVVSAARPSHVADGSHARSPSRAVRRRRAAAIARRSPGCCR